MLIYLGDRKAYSLLVPHTAFRESYCGITGYEVGMSTMYNPLAPLFLGGGRKLEESHTNKGTDTALSSGLNLQEVPDSGQGCSWNTKRAVFASLSLAPYTLHNIFVLHDRHHVRFGNHTNINSCHILVGRLITLQVCPQTILGHFLACCLGGGSRN